VILPGKMKISIFFFLVWVTILSIGASVHAESTGPGENVVSLDELYKLALDRSEQVGISEEDLFLARQTRKKAFSVLVPELSAFGTYTRYMQSDSLADAFSAPEGFDAADAFSFSSPDSTTMWGLQLSQTFTLNGKELIALKITGETIEKNEYDLSTVKEEFLLGVAAAYYNVMRSVKAMDIALANVERLTTYRDSVSVKLSLEEVPKTDMYRAEAELSSAKAELIATENAVKYAKAALSQLVGFEGDYSVSDVAAGPDPTKTSEIEDLKEVAFQRRTELKSMEKQKIIADDQVRFYRSEYWPTVSIAGSYSKTEAEPADALVMSSEDLSASLTVNLPLFDGGLKKAQVGEAFSKKRQADLAYRSTKKQIALEVEQSYLAVVSARGVLEALGDQVTFAHHNYEAVLKQFKFGMANSVDIMDANTSLVTAERQLTDANYTYQLAILKLSRSQGLFLSSLEEKGLL